MLRKYEEIKNNVEALMAEEGEGVSLPETNKREQSTETKEAVRLSLIHIFYFLGQVD